MTTNPTTPGAPVPPDELIDTFYFDWYHSIPFTKAELRNTPGSSCRHDLAKHFAAWGYAQAIPERQELAELLEEAAVIIELHIENDRQERIFRRKLRAAAERLSPAPAPQPAAPPAAPSGAPLQPPQDRPA
jgi:hypothetical protein